MKFEMHTTSDSAAPVVAFLGLIAAIIGAYLTHVIWILKTLASPVGATAGQIVLGILGIFVPPLGVLHGLMIWFGIGW